MIIKRISYACVAGVFAGAIALWFVGSALSAPVNAPVGPPPGRLEATSVEFPSNSGATIAAWFGAPREGAPTIILSHGVRGSRAQLAERAKFLRSAGYGVLLYDAQGHGESIASNITFGFLEAHDAAAAVEFARAESPGSKVGFVGPSLAGASALLGPDPLPVDALVLEAVYPTLVGAVQNRISIRLGELPAKLLSPLLLWQVESRLGFDPFALNPIERVGEVRAPLLLIAGSEDRHTTILESEALFEAAPKQTEFWVINGASHQSFHRFARAEYEQRILKFFERHLKQSTAQHLSGPRLSIGDDVP